MILSVIAQYMSCFAEKKKKKQANQEAIDGIYEITTIIDTDKKLLDTAKYSDYSEINVTAEKELNDIKVILENKSDEIKVTGISKTHPDDIFDVKIGTELAYYRALEKFYSEKVKRIVKKIY